MVARGDRGAAGTGTGSDPPAVTQQGLLTPGCSQSRPQEPVPVTGARASRRSPCQPQAHPPGHPAHRSHPISVPRPAHLLVPATISHSRRGWQEATGVARVYCGSSAYSRCRAGRASSPRWSISPRWARAVPRVRPASTAGAAPPLPGSGCARTAPLGEPRAGRAGLVPVLPVPLRGRHRTGTGLFISWAVTSGQSGAGANGSTAAGSPKTPFPGVLTLLTPPHPRSAASQAPRAQPSSSGGDEGRVRARPGRGTESIPSFILSAAGREPAPEPPARATAARGGRKTGNTGHGWGKAKGTYAPPPARAPQSPWLLSVPSRKTAGWKGSPGDAGGFIPATAASRTVSASSSRDQPLLLPADATAEGHRLPRLSPP